MDGMDVMDAEGEALHLMRTTGVQVRLLSPYYLLLSPFSSLLTPSPPLLFSSSHPVLCIAAAIAFIESRMSA
jgi:hypothetical protein